MNRYTTTWKNAITAAGAGLVFLILLSTAVRAGPDECERLREKKKELAREMLETRKTLIARTGELKQAEADRKKKKRAFDRAVDFYHSLRNLKDLFRDRREEMLEKRNWAQKERIWGDALRIVADTTYKVSSKTAMIMWEAKNAQKEALEDLYSNGGYRPGEKFVEGQVESAMSGRIAGKLASRRKENLNLDEMEGSFKKRVAKKVMSEVEGTVSDAVVQKMKSGEIDPKELAPDLADVMKSAGDFANNWAQDRANKAIEETEEARDQFHEWYIQNHTLLLKTRDQIQTQKNRVDELQRELNRYREQAKELKARKAALENKLNALQKAYNRLKKEVVKCYISSDEKLGREDEDDADPGELGDAGKKLQAAARAGHLRRVINLLAEGADPNWRGNQGNTPLMTAARRGHGSIVETLLEAGADPDLQNQNGNTALILASRHGHPYAVKVLIDNGANKRITNNQGRNPIQTASENGNSDCRDLLK